MTGFAGRQGGAERAGVVHRPPHVGAGVDARDHQVEGAAERPEPGEHHAQRRGPGHGPHVVGRAVVDVPAADLGLDEMQRAERRAGTGELAIGGDNDDLVVAVDDEQTMQLMRLFNESEGRDCLRREGVDATILESLGMLGISGICNLVASIKTARYYDMDSRDVIFMPLTDAMSLYASRRQELELSEGPYTATLAERHHARYLQGISTDNMRELSYLDRKALHNFKYFTWVEQQGREP